MPSYFLASIKILKTIENTQKTKMLKAAQLLAKCAAQDGLIYTLGSGHSLSVALEPFHRSGSLACVSAVLDPSFNFMPSAHAATELERLEGYTPVILKRHNITAKDVIIIISNSGRNPAGIDAALYAKSLGAKVIVITALKAHKATTSRHTSGKMLRECADIAIDNCCPKQETALTLKGKSIAPVSTIAGAAVMNNIMYLTAEILTKQGKDVPLYLSSNDGGDDNNARLAQKYKGRILHLD